MDTNSLTQNSNLFANAANADSRSEGSRLVWERPQLRRLAAADAGTGDGGQDDFLIYNS